MKKVYSARLFPPLLSFILIVCGALTVGPAGAATLPTVGGSANAIGPVGPAPAVQAARAAAAAGTPSPVAWGDRTYGQLGDGLTGVATLPTAVDQSAFAGGIPTAISASNGNAFSCAVAGGKAYCWGSNGTGQLGTGAALGVLKPTAVSTAGVLAGKVVTAVDAGTFDACAIAAGRAYCWGQGSKLGSVVPDRNAYYRTPLAVDTSGALAGLTITAITVGRNQTCVIAGGRAYCWGQGMSQNLPTSSDVPVAMGASGVLAGKTVTAITAGEEHACAIADGNAYCWGRNFDGQLGDGGSGTGDPVAVDTTGALAGRTITAISAGAGQTCAVATGLAFCWGSYGALGDGVEDYQRNLTPTVVTTAGVLSGKTVTAISAAYRLTCAVADGRAYCWGDRSLGSESARSAVPIAVGGALASSTISQLSAGESHACALTSTGKLYCWGSRQAGMLGDGTDYFADAPVATKSDGALAGHPVTAIAASGKHSCAIADQRAYCWGSNWYGGLGNNSTVDSTVPVAVSTSGVLNGKTVTAISAAGAYQVENPPESQTCVVASGRAYCWGNNYTGNLGNGSTAEASRIPVAVSTAGVLAGKTVTAIAVGDSHACAVADAKPYCWGDNTSGQLGNGTNSRSSVPVAVTVSGSLAGKVITAITTGDRHTCVIAEGAPFCWGNNASGELGNTSTTSSNIPVAVTRNAALAGLTVTGISGGSAHTCAIAAAGAFCWGGNSSRQLGDGTTVSRSVPTAVLTSGAMNGTTVTGISAGSSTTCAVANAKAYCWGADYQGSLGDGGAATVTGPVAVDTSGALAGRTVAAIAVGAEHVVAIAADPVVPPVLTPGTFRSVAPARILDTRTNSGAPGPVPALGTITIQITGKSGIPTTGVAAIALNVTAVTPTANGYLTAWPNGTTRPDASNLNFTAGQNIPNTVIVPVGTGGKIQLFNGSTGTIQILADVAGYYLAGTPTAAGAFATVSPARILDTRTNSGAPGPVPALGTITIQITGKSGIPTTGVAAIALNVTAVTPTANGYLTAWPNGTTRPDASNLNFTAGQNIPNTVIVPVGTGGKIQLFNGSTGTIQILADVAGYYLAGTPTAAGAFATVSPARILDTRTNSGAPGPVPALGTITIQITGKSGIPTTGVAAIALNVTAVTPTANGYLTAWPNGTTRPDASNLNFTAGQNIPNTVIVPVGTGGKIQLFNGSTGTIQILADVAGYYLG